MIIPSIPEKLHKYLKPVHTLLYRKYYIDEIYRYVFVRTALRFARLFNEVFDGFIFEWIGPKGVLFVFVRCSSILKSVQSGYIYYYALIMLTGLISILSYILYGGV